MAQKQKPIIIVKDPPPPRRGGAGVWSSILMEVVRLRGKYCMVKEFDSPEQTQAAQKNLSGRKVQIPYPDHDWTFAARDCELFAIYRGPKRGGRNVSVRRGQR